MFGAKQSKRRIVPVGDAVLLRASVGTDAVELTIVGVDDRESVNAPVVVIVPAPVFVNRVFKVESTARETLVTLPEPAEGATQLSVVPFEER
jgi:hypothetical protein